jgi:hypothetical protein
MMRIVPPLLCLGTTVRVEMVRPFNTKARRARREAKPSPTMWYLLLFFVSFVAFVTS